MLVLLHTTQHGRAVHRTQTVMDVDEDGKGPGDFLTENFNAPEAEHFALLKGAVKDAPTNYTAHLSLVGYLRKQRPGSLDLLRARQE